MTIHRTDIAVIGGGLAGLTLSCLLARRGMKVACLDRAPPLAGGGDLRTTAVSAGSRVILEEAGIWKRLAGKTCAIDKIDILDEESPILLDFLKSEADGKTFGWIVLNSDLRAAAMAELKTYKNARHLASAAVTGFEVAEDYARVLGDAGQIEARLVVGADGRGSFVREWMNVRTREWKYGQRAVICAIYHEYPHGNAAVEHFWPEGPFAVLPMADDAQGWHMSSVVFTEHGPLRKSLMRLSEVDFVAAVAAKIPERYGKVQIAGPRAAHELGFIHAASYIGPRMALVADAAHGIHPVAGQGLNLGFRDVKALADLTGEVFEQAEDIGTPELLAAYQRARRFDNMTMSAATDGLVRLFGSRLPPVRALRRAGLKAVARIPAAKRFFMKQAMGE